MPRPPAFLLILFYGVSLFAITIVARYAWEQRDGWFSAATSQANPADTASPVALATKGRTDQPLPPEVERLLVDRCAECHGGNSPEGNLDVTNRRSLFAFLSPGNAAASPLYQSIIDDSMPQDGGPLEQAEKEQIKRWIDSLAAQRTPFELADELALIAADMEQLPDHLEHRDVRYFSLRTAHNRTDISDYQLGVFRIALFKLLNSLHWEPRIIAPVAIDPQQLIYRINFNEFNWDEVLWSNAVSGRLWSLHPVGADARLRDAAARVVDACRFIDVASKPETYHALLYDRPDVEIDSLDDLYSRLGIRYDREFNKPPRVHRCFLNRGVKGIGSGVSDNFRVLDRLHGLSGPVWVSYDFAPTADAANLDKDVMHSPWGPQLKSENGSRSKGFRQDGGEVIFTLPNGLHGYLIVADAGERIEVAPSNIVSEPDLLASARSIAEISTGGSCFRCHSNGFLPAKMTLPESHALAQLAPDHRPALFTEESLTTILNEDNAIYADTMAHLIEVSQQEFREPLAIRSAEPINYVIRDFNAPLDATRAAVELATTVAELTPLLERMLSDARGQFDTAPLNDAIAQSLNLDKESLRLLGNAAHELAQGNPITRADLDSILLQNLIDLDYVILVF